MLKAGCDFRLLCVLLCLGFSQSLWAQAISTEWKVSKTYWSDQDEQAYQKFIQALGRSSCNTFDLCIKDSANPYRATDPQNVRFFSDCADLPYVLRAYYAWKNELPYTYTTGVHANDLTPEQLADIKDPINNDIRYSRNGNHVIFRKTIPQKGRTDFLTEMVNINNAVSSGTLRIGPEADNSDFYSPAIQKQSIHPGTVVYDPSGHVVVVYDVNEDGTIRYFDAHPDNSISRGSFSQKFARSIPTHGAGFKNFRPFELVAAKFAADGSLKGGRPVLLANKDIADYSTAQYFGTNPAATWSQGSFILENRTLSFYDYVRLSLSAEGYKINPLQELERNLNELCYDFQERVRAVDVATQAGIHLRDHPERLPRNIYGADGEWEEYSSPGRDIRLKDNINQIKLNVADYFKKQAAQDPHFSYSGNDLKDDLIKVFHQANFACSIGYMNSQKQFIQLSLSHVMARMLTASFDPYHCPERRWGATYKEELKSCQETPDKVSWYKAEQRLRNSMVREYDIEMGFSLNELLQKPKGSGTDLAPDLDVLKYLEDLP